MEHFGLDIQLGQGKAAWEDTKWDGLESNPIMQRGNQGKKSQFVISGIGQYTDGKNCLTFPGRKILGSQIIPNCTHSGLEILAEPWVAVVGFGRMTLW